MEYALHLFNRFSKCLVRLAALLVIGGSLPSLAQPASPAPQSQTSAAALAGQLLTKITMARARFLSDFGPRAFDRMDFPGGRTPGDVWSEYLTTAGYPSSLDEREQMVKLLPDLDRQAQTALYMAPAREEAFEHLVTGLKRIASGTAQPLVPKKDLKGALLSVVFGEDTSIQTTLETDDRSSYQPRSNDEISWQFACAGGGLPDLNTGLRGCFEKNYGYLIANADKKPLDSEQGRYVFAGTRTSGEPMVFEAPSGDCRPRFLELKARACTLQVRVSRPAQ
ncbi:hypothetical protein [Bradyrhizobium sp. RT11b]|uniref:hypothetical protein n=1 Tax=Bradyrhizobium sp. RT11b TaxID=3156332 RepID=UPI00339AF179